MIRELYYQVLVYRSLITPFLIASAITAPCWIAFRIYRHRARAERVSPGREALLLVFVVYLACLAAATLAPNHNSRLLTADTTGIELRPSLATLTCSSPGMPTGSRERHFCMYNTKGNIVLFLPFGLLLPLIWRRMSIWNAILLAAALSVSIEMIQLLSRAWGSYRAADINDVVLNVFGACIGLGAVFVLRSLRGIGKSAPAVRSP